MNKTDIWKQHYYFFSWRNYVFYKMLKKKRIPKKF